MENSSFLYPAFAFILVLVSLILIPRERYRIIFPVIIISVLIHAVFLYVAINVVRAFQFSNDEPFAILGIPIFISDTIKGLFDFIFQLAEMILL